MEIVKSLFLSYHNNGCYKQKKFCQKLEFHGMKNLNYQKKGAKTKNITILHFMTTFHNFALRIETG